MRHRLEHMGRSGLIYNIVISAAAILNLFPLYWMISGSLKVSQGVSKMPPDWIPFSPVVQNYRNLFQAGHALTWTCNSFLIAIEITTAILLVSAMASYSFAKLRFWGRNTTFLAFILTLIVLKEIYIVLLVKVMQYLSLKGTYMGIILPNVALPFGMFLLCQFFATVSDSLRELAWLDGGSEWNVFAKIMLPICKPGLSALAILMFARTWNDYLWQMVMIVKDSMKILQLGVILVQQENNPDYGLKMASTCVAAVPMILVFFVFQRYFTSGITMGAIKE